MAAVGGAGTSEQPQLQSFSLAPEQELRFEVDGEKKVTLVLKRGTAEIFGTELAANKPYIFTSTKLAVFCWHGATIEVDGPTSVAYVSSETPMVSYVNVHHVLEQRRQDAARSGTLGPRVLIAGPVDVGKSTVCRILVNYAARMGHKPVYADVDIGQGSISLPGTIGAIQVERPIDVEEGYSTGAPLVYNFGHLTPSANASFFKMLVAKLSSKLEEKAATDASARVAGTIINTCGWIDGLGFTLLTHSIDTLKVDVVLVLDNERLFNELQNHVRRAGAATQVLRLAKSAGVVVHSVDYRRVSRNRRVREYFYGPTNDLSPSTLVIRFADLHLFKVGAPPVPLSMLPIGAAPVDNETKVTAVTPSMDLVHSVLALASDESDAKMPKADSNILGFVYVSDVDMAKGELTVLAPSPGRLPRKFLMYSQLKWME
eukprot:Opistho-2@29241